MAAPESEKLNMMVTLLWGALLAVLIAFFWFSADSEPDYGSLVSIVPDTATSAASVPVDETADMRSLDSLWQRYERLNAELPAAVGQVDLPKVAGLVEKQEAPDATRLQMRERRAADRAEREAALSALFAARDEVVVLANQSPLSSGAQLADALRDFAARLADTGAHSAVNFDALTTYIEKSTRMQQLVEQVIAESSRGQSADISRVQALNEEIQQLQRSMPINLVDTSALRLGPAASP